MLHERYPGVPRIALTATADAPTRRDAAAPKKQKRRREPAERAAGAARATLAPEHRGLFDTLRAHRRELARAPGVPPYVIFHDVTLEAMADQQPRTLDELATLPGVGEKKLERYAETFIEVIAGHG